ncbi:MAG TPA: hypothetical protein VH950_18825 [Gaiellaceae bacterium]
MSHLIWTPGAAGPLDELVSRILRMVEQFTAEHGVDQAEVRVELADGSRHLLASASAEPGFGFLSFSPHAQEGDEPRRVIVPIGAVKLIEISAPDPEHQFGFARS